MLASSLDDISLLKYPVLCTPKLDGIRCLTIGNSPMSRKLKPIPNRHVCSVMSSLPDNLDGELMLAGANFNSVQSAIMTVEGTPDFQYYVFDVIQNLPYSERIEHLKTLKLPDFCIKVIPILINNEQELLSYEEKCINDGYEGVMIRSLNSPYKFGRSTLKEQYLLKLKRFQDSEAIVLDFEEKMLNTNESKINELGYLKKSSHKDNLVPANTLGSLTVKDITTNKIFNIGTGYSDDVRKEIWDNRNTYKGKTLTYKYQPHGMLDLPRCPVFKGFRHLDDL